MLRASINKLSGFALLCIACLFVLPLFFAATAGVAHADTGAAVDSVSAVGSLLAVLPEWLQALSVLVTACAGIAALTPTPKDDGVLLILRRIIDFLALNFGNAKNAKSSQADRPIG